MHPSPDPTTAPAADPGARRRAHRRSHTAAFVLVSVGLWVYIGVVLLHLWHNPVMPGTWFLLGAAIVPVTVFWIMLHRLRVSDTVTGMDLVSAAVIGGTLAVVLGGSMDSLVGFIPQERMVVSYSLAGFVEEFAKGVLIVVLGWRVAKTTRNGLFVGGAVGLGFAVLETLGYILESVGTAHPLLAAAQTALVRGITAPFGHVLWSSLLGAALFAAAGAAGRFRISGIVVGVYVGVAVLHGIWDASASFAADLSPDTVVAIVGYWFGIVVPIAIGVPLWWRVARRASAPGVADAADPERAESRETVSAG